MSDDGSDKKSDGSPPKSDGKAGKSMKERVQEQRKAKKEAAAKKKEEDEKKLPRFVQVLGDLTNVWTGAMVIEMALLAAAATWNLAGTLSLLFFMLLFNVRTLHPVDPDAVVQQNCVFNGVLWIVYGASSLPVLLSLPFAWTPDGTLNFTIFLVVTGLVRGAVGWAGLVRTNEVARTNFDEARAAQAQLEQAQKDELQRAKAKYGRVEVRQK